jgi:protein-tyrosine phosphatase
MIDLHSHVLPGLDDGPRDVAGTREILAAAREDGIERIAATPHVRDDHPTDPADMERLVDEANALAMGVEVLPGGELDLRYLQGLDDATLRRFGLGGNPSLLLVETPYVGWPLDLRDAVFGLAVRGFTVVLAHPERNPEVQERPDRLRDLVEAGVFVQLTAASVDGRLGRRPAAASKELLSAGLAHLVASDAHAPAVRAVGMQAAVDALCDEPLGRWLTHAVPAALLDGSPLPPRPERRRTMRLPWHR